LSGSVNPAGSTAPGPLSPASDCDASARLRWVWRFEDLSGSEIMARPRSDGTIAVVVWRSWERESEETRTAEGALVRRFRLPEVRYDAHAPLTVLLAGARGELVARRELGAFGRPDSVAIGPKNQLAITNGSKVMLLGDALAELWSAEVSCPKRAPGPELGENEEPLDWGEPLVFSSPKSLPTLAVAFDRQGNLFAARRCKGPPDDLVLTSFDLGGKERGLRTISARQLHLSSLRIADDGRVYVAGAFCGQLATAAGTLTAKPCRRMLLGVDGQGKVTLARAYAPSRDSEFVSLATLPGRVALGGSIKSPAPDRDVDAELLVVDPSGHELFTRRFGELWRGGGAQQQTIDVVAPDRGGWLVGGRYLWSVDAGGFILENKDGERPSQEARAFLMRLDERGKVLAALTPPDFARVGAGFESISPLANGDFLVAGTIDGELGASGEASGGGSFVARLCPLLPGAAAPPKKPADTRKYAVWQSFPMTAPRNGLDGTLRLFEDSTIAGPDSSRRGWDQDWPPTTLPARLELVDSAGKVLGAATFDPVVDIEAKDLGDGTTTFLVRSHYECLVGSCSDITVPYQVRDSKLGPLRTVDEKGSWLDVELAYSTLVASKIVPAGVGNAWDILQADLDPGGITPSYYVRHYFDGHTWRHRTLTRDDKATVYNYDWSNFPVKRPGRASKPPASKTQPSKT
jgi:hypothetical protein